ncbi:MAG: ATP synthase subunit I [Desulfobacteraceae bacterium]
MKTQQRILNFVSRSNWLLLIIASAIGFNQFSFQVGLGVAAGGLIVTINFHLLAKTLKKALTPPHIASVKGVIIKYYLRFTFTAIIIYMLMLSKHVDPMGLIAGLSVVVASMMFATLNEVRQLITKEAG